MSQIIKTADALRDLNLALEAMNGPAEFNEDKEAYGFISDGEKLAIPTFFNTKFDYVTQTETTGATLPMVKGNLGAITMIKEDGTVAWPATVKDFTPKDMLIVITAINIGRMGKTQDANLGALLRGILCVRGMLLPMPANDQRSSFTTATRCVYQDEVIVLNQTETNAAFDANLDEALKTMNSASGKFILKNWPSICSALSIVFMSRGHHFQGEDVIDVRLTGSESGRYNYAQLYNAILKAGFPAQDDPFTDRKTIFRTALHPFGVYIMRKIHFDYANAKKLPAGIILRVVTAPAGTAKVTTGSAILKMMSGSPFFISMRDRIRNATSSITNVAESILSSPTKYHQNSTLYGAMELNAKEKADLADAMNSVTSLAPLLVGYIRSECGDAPITKQKTLNKPAQDQAGLLNRVVRVFGRIDDQVDRLDPSQLVQALFPTGTPIAPINALPAPGPVVTTATITGTP